MRQFQLVVNNVLQLAEEPRVDLRQFENAVNSIPFLQGLSDGKHTQVGRMGQFIIQIIEFQTVIAYKTVHALSDHTQPLLDNLLKSTSDRHDFTNRLHAGTDFTADTREFRQVPTRDLTNQIIQLRSDVRRVGSSHLTDLVERIAQCNLGSHKRQRETGSLGCQCRGT